MNNNSRKNKIILDRNKLVTQSTNNVTQPLKTIYSESFIYNLVVKMQNNLV